MPTRDAVELTEALENIENHAVAARDYADALVTQNNGLQEDVEGLQAANRSLIEENQHLLREAQSHKKDVENLNRACDELRAIVASQRGEVFQHRSDIKRLENKLELAQEQLERRRFVTKMGVSLFNLAKAYPIAARDLIDGLQETVDHLDGDDLDPPITPFDRPRDNQTGWAEDGPVPEVQP